MLIRGMDDQARRFVDDKQVVILVNERECFGFHSQSIDAGVALVNSFGLYEDYLLPN